MDAEKYKAKFSNSYTLHLEKRADSRWRILIDVSFRQSCVRPLESGFLLGQEAANAGSADPEPTCDLGFADALAE